MDLRQLRYFIALNEHRSFVRGAEAMGITQPAFSRSIQTLEQEFGCVLVDRASKDLRPTPEGHVVLQHALRLIKDANLLTREVAEMTKLDAGELRFGCGPAPAVKLVPDAVARFINAHPKVRVGFDVANWETLSRSLNRDDIEFFIADIRHFESDPNFHTQALTPRRGVFFCRPGHPLLDKDSLSTNDLFDYPVAATLLPPGFRKLLATASGRSDFSPGIQTDHFASLVKIVTQTDAIGISSEEGFAADVAPGALVRLQWRNLSLEQSGAGARCGIVSRTGFRLSPAARAMIETIISLDQVHQAA
ncbi:LysR family transcriptional regulator [Pseudomonas syringae]|uniref:LysR family transcriptional regulator n=1 Tax=Pseudomonas sp. Leaf127 TaxID=1736267 RepID=UPI0007032881|nr:LysR family transcriptional regulator [Pseudomonas sp. Leaf127]MBD8492355.1 LysR family transcriptional regulator [Pseudomonas syringae]KQQ50851.1 transcriptional regulator [Pseudomonas sp. Leaf127]MBD8574768.1 LysR family transcriptional regulator [Pseudomonas syringae]MBD8789792.1 LysR family transcriptional regulator [Pseudomonas syringae]MBD8800981.1 LysR family transcriptional regulator [Pseudomonas syringae]